MQYDLLLPLHVDPFDVLSVHAPPLHVGVCDTTVLPLHVYVTVVPQSELFLHIQYAPVVSVPPLPVQYGVLPEHAVVVSVLFEQEQSLHV